MLTRAYTGENTASSLCREEISLIRSGILRNGDHGLRICYLAGAPSPLTQRWVWALVEKGHHVTLLTFHPIPAIYAGRGVPAYSLLSGAPVGSGNDGWQRPLQAAQNLGVLGRLRGLVCRALPPAVARLVYLEVYAYRARRILRKLAPDIVHGHFATHYGYIGARTGFHPLVITAMGSDILIEPRGSVVMRMILRYALSKADTITATSLFVSRQGILQGGIPPDKMVVFPRGVNLKNFCPSTDPSPVREKLGWRDNEVLIMTRNFMPVYGIEYFVEALPEVIANRPKVRVLFVGAGPTLRACRRRIKELALDRYVRFVGRVYDDQQVAAYLQAADIYVTTSLSDGTSNSMLEAMACGLPVVVSDAPAHFEWVEDAVNGFIVPRKDSLVLAERLVELLGNPALRTDMGEQNIRITRERADWEVNFGNLERIYETLVGRFA